MSFKLIYFYPKDTFMVKVKVTETYFGRKLEILRIFVKQFTYLGYNKLFSIRNMLYSATQLRKFDNMP